jgi:hypothetical protein
LRTDDHNIRAAAWLNQLIKDKAPELKFDEHFDINKLTDERLVGLIQQLEALDNAIQSDGL